MHVFFPYPNEHCITYAYHRNCYTEHLHACIVPLFTYSSLWCACRTMHTFSENMFFIHPCKIRLTNNTPLVNRQ